ncbi:hypothetical protein B5F12_01390 [Pseudoflavonifractor sp. An176]|uniref:hypothetical protein n=1 Tax=Pseudoflavonifractor sp. An176 TaxID=1965572 RepID=UPI000B3A5224|nr:hypothetical protein [Pseudoflavonifractor sp. An176]OUP66199.1 hypothetical protein B5F12_01390 [Pseudoflavonifractor sp. An176]
MSWRVVVVSSNAKVDYKLEYLVVRTVDEVKRVHLSEVGVLMLESTAISLTTYLLCELVRRKIMERVRDNKPPQGLIQMLTVTERQFAKMELVLGEYRTEIIDDERRLVIL